MGREEHVIASGIRLVGKGARELAARLSTAPLLLPGRESDALFGARFLVRPRMGADSPTNAILQILGRSVAESQPDAPPLARDRSLEIPPTRFSGVYWDVIGERESWTGELIWRHPHPVIAGAPITTHLMLAEQPGRVVLHVRVSADEGIGSVRGAAGAGQARPVFLSDLNRALRLVSHGFDSAPAELVESEIDRFVRDVLLGDDRDSPVAVLAPLEEGGFVVPPEDMADALLGLAPLYVIPRHPSTYRLSDSLGDRRLSAYWGALRVYMPGFSCADRSSEHPLLVRDQLIDPVMRADLLGRLGRWAAEHVMMPTSVRDRQAPLAQVTPIRVNQPDARPAETNPAPPPATPGTPNRGPAPDQHELVAAVARLSELTAAVLEEVSRLRMTMAVRSASTNGLERRIDRFGALLAQLLTPSDERPSEVLPAEPEPAESEAAESPPTVLDALRHAADAHPETLLILEAAERAAASAPYEDIDKIGVVLDAMAEVARRRMEGSLGMSLRDAFRELGIDYRGGISESTSARLRQQYCVAGPDGRTYDCVEHLVLGTSYDPRYCLRIYFTSRAPLEARFVIGHIGKHFKVATTT